MVRPIKYRIWNKLNKKMGKVLNLGLEGWWSVVEYEDGSQDSLMIPGEIPVELMQFTGLKDVDGVEIYEGNILTIPDYFKDQIDCGVYTKHPENHISEVVYNEKLGCFGVMIKEFGEVFCRGFLPLHQVFEEWDINEKGESFKVVGNKFEDKELLE